MVQVLELVRYCDETLSSAEFSDYAPNGLQVEGTREVSRLCSAVTASRAVVERAVEAGADALLVHHGYFWKGEPAPLVGMKGERVRRLMAAGVSLLAYHLPLDAHPELGNNACLAARLALRVEGIHAGAGVPGLLWEGQLDEPQAPEAFAAHVAAVTGREPLHVGSGPARIRRLAWCTGAAEGMLGAAAALGVDAFISGEISERTTHEARELGVHYFAAGHHATERYGVQALADHLAGVFGLEHLYLEDDNPV
ncbi:Nif3-like dinuclear metal center hexameric protein [Arhodomonas sp. SL1]|uniref:Nif3-like dinuclear metal center hexameric protein n=1 Tax=Arhodomonas sp. SL1 TaxID=3425691 RepID=UPI003F8846DB